MANNTQQLDGYTTEVHCGATIECKQTAQGEFQVTLKVLGSQNKDGASAVTVKFATIRQTATGYDVTLNGNTYSFCEDKCGFNSAEHYAKSFVRGEAWEVIETLEQVGEAVNEFYLCNLQEVAQVAKAAGLTISSAEKNRVLCNFKVEACFDIQALGGGKFDLWYAKGSKETLHEDLNRDELLLTIANYKRK